MTYRGWFDRHWGWVITAVTFLHFFANYGFLYSYGQLLVVFQNEFHTGATLTGWLGTIPFGLTYLASPISNSLIARFEHRSVAVIGVIACFVSLIVTSFMTSLLPMFFTFSLLYGLGINFVTVSGLNIILQYFPEKHSARSVTIALMGCNMGLLALNPFFYFLNAYVGWRNALRIAAAAVLGTGIGAASTFTRRTPHPVIRLDNDVESKGQCAEKNKDEACQTKFEKDGYSRVESEDADLKNGQNGAAQYAEQNGNIPLKEEKNGDENGGKVVVIRRYSWLSVLNYPELWFLALALVACSAGVCFFYISLVNFLVSRGFDDETSAMAMTALGVSQVVGKILVALVGDHLPFAKMYALVFANVLGAGLVGSLLATNSLIGTYAVIIIAGLFVISILDTLPHAISHQIFPPDLCVVSWTVFISAMGSGYIVGALLGESMDRTGSYDAALYVCLVLFLVSAALCVLVLVYQACCRRPTQRRDRNTTSASND